MDAGGRGTAELSVLGTTHNLPVVSGRGSRRAPITASALGTPREGGVVVAFQGAATPLLLGE
jgi:hypothetical protein